MQFHSVERNGTFDENGTELYTIVYAVEQRDMEGNSVTTRFQELRSKEAVQEDTENYEKRASEWKSSAQAQSEVLEAINAVIL